MTCKRTVGYGIGGYGPSSYSGNAMVFFEQPGYYLAKITSQYQNSPKFLAWLMEPLQILDDITTVAYNTYSAFDLDYAVGSQLDILGAIVGASRTVKFTPHGGVSPVLDDKTYRILILATLGADFWDGTIDSLQALWKSLFPSGSLTIQDHQDMSFTVIMSGAFTSIIQDLIMQDYIVPRPEGVLINYVFSDLPLFGCDLNNAFVAGVDLGHMS